MIDARGSTGVSVKSHSCIIRRSTSGHRGGQGLPGGWQQRGHPGVAGPGLAAGTCPTTSAPAIARLHQGKGWARAGLGLWPVGGPGSAGAMAGQGRTGPGGQLKTSLGGESPGQGLMAPAAEMGSWALGRVRGGPGGAWQGLLVLLRFPDTLT